MEHIYKKEFYKQLENKQMKYTTITLNNGVEMPQIGFGTYLIPCDKVVDTIGKAYELGYRQFDTAGRYRNQEYIAAAMKKYNMNLNL